VIRFRCEGLAETGTDRRHMPVSRRTRAVFGNGSATPARDMPARG
jgi:hypothetical protein